MFLEIHGDTLLWVEMYACATLLAVLFAWVIFEKVPVAFLALVITMTVLAAGAFRPPEYNSDTTNYFSYVEWLSFFNIEQAILLTKLEPVHSVLAVLLRDFRSWLIAENIISGVGLVLCYRSRTNDFSFVALCAFLLSLSTSSLRYAISLVYFLYFLYLTRNTIWSHVRMTALLLCFHISMLLSGLLSYRRIEAPLVITAGSALIIYQQSLLGQRAEEDFTEASFGLKTLATVLGVMLYFAFRSYKRIKGYHAAYGLNVFAMFAAANLALPTFNRFLIMAALALLAREWSHFRDNERDMLDRLFLVGLCGLILVPYIVLVPGRYYAGMW